MKVHYKRAYENAFWDGSAMYFGDGKQPSTHWSLWTSHPMKSVMVSIEQKLWLGLFLACPVA